MFIGSIVPGCDLLLLAADVTKIPGAAILAGGDDGAVGCGSGDCGGGCDGDGGGGSDGRGQECELHVVE